MKKYIRVLLPLLIVNTNLLLAQQLLPLSNFMHNQLLYNPASAGMHEAQFNVSTITRMQMVNNPLKGGVPFIGAAWGDYRSKSNNNAIGIVANGNQYSGYKNLDLNLNYAHYINITRKIRLAMGLRGGLISSSFSTNGFKIWDNDDATIANSEFQKISPKFGFGFQLNSKNSYIGISSEDFVTAPRIDIHGDTASNFWNRKRNINLMAGSKIKLGDRYNFRPNLGVFYYSDKIYLAKINSTFEVKDYCWAGITYSTNNFITLNFGTNISSRMKFAYAFDSNFRSKGSGYSSHELNLFITLDNLFRKN